MAIVTCIVLKICVSTLRPYELAMIEVMLSLSNLFMASEISMTCIKMYFGRLMNVYGTDVLLVCNIISLSPCKLTRISATGRIFRNVEPFDRAPSMLANW